MSPEDTAVPGATPGAAPTGATPTTQTPTPDVPATETPQGTPPDQPKTPLTLEEAMDLYRQTQAQLKDRESALAKTRAESIDRRKKLDAFEAEEKKRQEAAMSEQERTQKQLADAQRERDEATRQLQETRISHAVQRHAAKLGFIDPDDAARFVDWARLDFDSEGKPTNAEDLLKELAGAKPYLVRVSEPPKPAAAPHPGTTNPQRGTAGTNGKVQVTADQYNDPKFREDFLSRYGKTVFQAGNDGDLEFINTPLRRR